MYIEFHLGEFSISLDPDLLSFKETQVKHRVKQSGRSPKVIALFSATNISNFILELLQLHDAIKFEWKYAWVHYNIAIRSHLMI